MHDRLPWKGMCLGSRDLLKFWAVSGSISETVQDRYSFKLQWKAYRKSCVDYQMAPYR